MATRMSQRSQGRRDVALPAFLAGLFIGVGSVLLLTHTAPLLLGLGIHVAILAGAGFLSLGVLRCALVALVKTARQWPHQRAINMKYTGKSCFWKV